MSALFVHGWALVSAAGASAASTCKALDEAPPAPAALRLGAGALAADYPYRPIATPAAPAGPDWTARAHAWARRVIEGAGGGHAATWLVASSSLDIGRVDADGRFSAGTLALAEEIAATMNFGGPLLAVDSACTSSYQALAVAQTLLHRAGPEDPTDGPAGEPAPEALVLGLELRSRFVPAGFAAMQLTTPWPAPGGLVLGEGVAALRVSRRPGRWCIAGIAHVVDGAMPSGTSAPALREAIEAACAAARITPAAIGRVKVHAAGHAESDSVEAEVLAACLDPRAERVHLKPWLGHTQGASGALEIALLLERLATVAPTNPLMHPPTNPAAHPAAHAAAHPSAHPSLRADLRHTLVLGLGFGGGHAALVLEDRHAAGRGALDG